MLTIGQVSEVSESNDCLKQNEGNGFNIMHIPNNGYNDFFSYIDRMPIKNVPNNQDKKQSDLCMHINHMTKKIDKNNNNVWKRRQRLVD